MDAIPKIYRQFGDVCQLNIEMQVTIAGETSLLIRKSIRRYMLEMRDNLGYESSTFVERMLIDEICLRWLKLQLT